MGNIAISKLQPHPKNGYYFTDISGEKYEEVKRSIKANGIRDAIKCTPAFTVISGHQRLRIANDLGLMEVPVEIIDVDEWEAEYLLIAENVERRGQAEQDPIKKAHIAQFLKEWWGVKRGSRSDLRHNVGSSKIAEVIGESIKTTERLLKLNELIPQLQNLVSAGKLGTTSAEQLAYLTPEVQSALYDALGEEIGERTVAETKQLRQEANGKSADDIQRMLAAEKVAKEQAQAEVLDGKGGKNFKKNAKKHFTIRKR
ncbi:ParB/RepB/Spo0J family partition protein [Lysinibacillus capsici]|uniref:ParB/RepB/Spo0J family partition protein n=1 Tax=Lysinibacillus capsici TaxID=2115968 RepID=UPI0034E2C29C